MKKRFLQIIGLVCVLCLLLTGCRFSWLFTSSFDDMVYVRPDVSALNSALERSVEAAGTEEDPDRLWNVISEFLLLYSDFCTQYLLSYVHYCQDLRDIYWTDEYNYCQEQITQVEAARDRLMRALAKSPLRQFLESEDYFGEGFFEQFDDESFWTEEFQALKEQEAQLEASYYQIVQEGSEVELFSPEYYDSYGLELEELFVELVEVRQQLAEEAGYDSYPEYAYEELYDRDFTVTQAEELCDQIRQELTPVYRQLAESDFWSTGVYAAYEYDTMQYVRTTARNMGGQVAGAFRCMEQYELYDIAPSEHKFDSAFEVYLYDYELPFVFVRPSGTQLDYLTFVHEFGHFTSDYASYGSISAIDIAEVFSQGMEYMSLFYGNASEELSKKKLGDGLCSYVEQAAYSSFEQQVYALSDEQRNVEQIRSIFAQVCRDFALDCWDVDERDYSGVSHFFIQPQYVISYVVSNDAAFQLYQKETAQTGTGLQIYLDALNTEQEAFLLFLEEAGLESPFTEGHIPAVRQTLTAALLPEAQ